MSWIQVGLGASSPLLGLTVHNNMYLLLVSGKPKKHKRRWSLWCWQQFVLFALVHVFIIVWGIISEGNTTARAADLTPLTAEKRFRPWIFPWEELLCGFTFIPLIMYSRKVTAPYFSSEINICGFFNEHFATPSPFPREGTSPQGGGRGVTLIHSQPPHPPHFGVHFSSDVLARSLFQGQRFPAQGVFLFTQIILLREVPCWDIKWEENKVGDLINELPVNVGMRGQIRHKNKIAQLNLSAERAS